MRNMIKQIAIAIVLILVSISTKHSIHIANFREYTRSEAGERISYPGDFLLSWYDKLSVNVGNVLGTLVILLFFCLYLMGVNTMHNKFLAKYSISKILTYLFSLWLVHAGIYTLVTSQHGQSFLLDPFFGKKIYYGGVTNVTNALEYEIKCVKTNETLSAKEKNSKLNHLENILWETLHRVDEEESFTEHEQQLRYMLR